MRRRSILSIGICLLVGGTGVAVFGQQDAKKRAVLSPAQKPAQKVDGKVPVRGAVLSSRDIPVEKMAGAPASNAASMALQIPLTIDTYASWDAKGDTSNDVLAIDVAGLAGLGTGNPATMTGAGWNVTVDTTGAPAVVSWLSEAKIEFDENVAPGTNWIALTPGFGDDFAGVATYDSLGIVDFPDAGVPDIVLPDGVLRIEFFEGYDDVADAIDALYTTGSAITIALLDLNSGACCDDATAACLTTDPATCAATPGQTFNPGEDCAAFTCPPPAADYIMDGTPVSTCSGTFADSGNTGAPYGPSEYIVKTFTPSTPGLALEFDFTFFDVETGWDSLTIYNGNSIGAPVIGTFDTGTPPGIITSGAGDGTLTFEFSSDGSVQWEGWLAGISCVSPPTGGACCDAVGGCTDVVDAAACSAGTYAGNGTNCASFTCPSPGDDCGGPIVVDFATALPFTDVGQTTCGRGNAYSSTCLGLYDGGEDIVYELVVPADTCVDIVMTSDTSYTGMAVDGVCPLGDPCLAEASSSANDESLLAQTLTAGTHYLMLDTWPAPDCIGSFDLSITECAAGGACCHGDGTCTDEAGGSAACVAAGDTYIGDGTACASTICPPPNDLCVNGTKISVTPFSDIGVAVDGATDDGNVDPSCDSSFSCDTGPANNGVWYTYTPTESCEATIDQAGMDASTSVWTGADCNSLTQVVCSDPDPFTVEMAAGTEYYILVSKWSCSSEPSSPIDFTFDCVPLVKGACCNQDASSCACTEVAAVDCTGTYRGDNTACTDSPDPCDCNGNGTCDSGDLLPGVADVYEVSGLALGIPDQTDPGISHILTVPTYATIADVNVDLQITHTWVGDLCVTLTHPSGTPTVQLIKRPGLDAECDAAGCCGCKGNDYAIILDDEAGGGPIEDMCGDPVNPTSPPSYAPDGLLSAFDGLDMYGDWTITVNDNGFGDTGTLDGWSLHFNAVPSTSSDCNGNGTPDECEADCDSNGVPDDCDINPADPDGNGLVAEDCNVNGSPDVCDLPPLGSGADCQGDGIPDECQLNTAYNRLVVVADGGFEGGTPNASWTEASTTFGTPLCDIASCGVGGGTGPHGGDWWCWFGGTAAVEDGSVEQTLTIPAGANTLQFYFENAVASGNGTDSVSALIDGNVVWSETEGNAAFATYGLVTVDITAYGDGGSHVLRFESSITGVPDLSNFFIDDIEILEPTGPPPNDCNLNGVPDECDAAVCGDGCLTGGSGGTSAEECDGADDAACPGFCFPVGHAFACQCPFCGDGDVSAPESCDGGVCCTAGCGFDTGTECRPSTGVCDPAESCDGAGADCPADIVITACIDADGCCPATCNNNNDSDCGAICGNGISEAAEVCDGLDDAACPGACLGNCACPVCGDDVVNQASETCDGTDDAACPGVCTANCGCPVAGSIPTASVWGLMTLTLLLLAGAKIYFGRRTQPVA